jgi:hypothetical protein
MLTSFSWHGCHNKSVFFSAKVDNRLTVRLVIDNPAARFFNHTPHVTIEM